MKNLFNKISNRVFPSILAITALAISASAAFYSVTGLGALFAGAFLAVVIMASTLEASKLVIASALYQYWSKMNKFLKTYLVLALIILIGITSVGIYGFLTSAYQKTANQSKLMDNKIALIDNKIKRYTIERDEYLNERQQLSENISDLTTALGNNTIQYTDESGNVITTQSSTQRKVLENNLDEAKQRRDYVNTQLEAANDSIATFEAEKIDVTINNDVVNELGPLIFVSESLNKSMSWVINRLLLLIIFVFDPLAITLVVLANFAFERVRIREQKQVIDNVVESTPETVNQLETEPKVTKTSTEVESEVKKDLKTTTPNWYKLVKKFTRNGN